MFLSLDILPLDTAGAPLQAIDNDSSSPDSANLEATFAEVMRAPLLVSNPEFTGVVGADLPVDGSSLPLAVDPELASLDDIGQIVAPVAAISSEPDVPLASDLLNPSLAELDEAKPAIIADVANNRAANIESPAGIHHLRPGADPFARQVLNTDQVNMPGSRLPLTVQDDGLELARANDQLLSQRPSMPVSGDASPRLQNRSTPELAAASLPLSTASVEAADLVQKPVPSPVSAVATAATIQAPQIQQLATTAAKTPAVLATSIDVPVFDENWGNALQDRVMWMTTRNIQNAEIRLNPAELGPIRVQVTVQDDAAQLTFTAQHALTRDALEVAMPRLREMLGENGLSLGDATVSDGDGSDVHKDSHAQESSAGENGEPDQEDTVEGDTTPLRRVTSSALLDTFV